MHWIQRAQEVQREVEALLSDLVAAGIVERIRWGGGCWRHESAIEPSVSVDLALSVPEATRHIVDIVERTKHFGVVISVNPSLPPFYKQEGFDPEEALGLKPGPDDASIDATVRTMLE